MDEALFNDFLSYMRSLAEGEIETTCLPAEMLGEEAEQAWLAILGSRKRIKELADKYRKLKVETGVPRKQLRVLPDAVLLSMVYSTPNLEDQLRGQLPEPQLEALTSTTLSDRYLKELLGHEAQHEIEDSLRLRNETQLRERIRTLLPASESTFSLAWGPTVYQDLLILIHLLRMGPTLEPSTPKYFQACFALSATLIDLVDTPLIMNLHEQIKQVPGFEDVYRGVAAYKLQLELSSSYDQSGVHPSARSFCHALEMLADEIRYPDPAASIRVFELLNTLFHPTHQGVKRVAEEFVEMAIRPYLLWTTKKLEDAIKLSGLEEGIPEIPEMVEFWELRPASTFLTTAYFRALQPLIDGQTAAAMNGWKDQIDEITAQAKEVSRYRLDVRALTSGANVDSTKIIQAAEHLNRAGQNMIQLVEGAITSIQLVLNTCTQAQSDWNRLTEELSGTAKDTAHLSDSASTEDQEILELALAETQSLRTQLEDSQKENHRLQVKVDASTFHQHQAYKGPTLSPELTRKLRVSPSDLSPAEVLTYIQHVGGERVQVLPSAWRSAEESANFENPVRMLDLLDRLVFDYAGALASGKPDSEAREILGGCYSARESDTVEKNQSMRAERTFQVNGAPRYFDRHLSIGNDAGGVRGMRIYFDIIDGVITIAYCGKHLTVYSTN